MAKIVIDIPNDTYYRCKNERVGLLPFDIPGVCYAIKNGTVLPKGHGRLIDASNLMTVTDYDGENEKTYITYDEIENAPTILEADKEGQE